MDEEDEEQVGNGPDTVVDTCDQKCAVACDSQSVVHDCLVVTNDVCDRIVSEIP